jgi:hypothetical protein
MDRSSIVREGCRKAKTYGGRGMLAVEGLEKLAYSNWPNGAAVGVKEQEREQ